MNDDVLLHDAPVVAAPCEEGHIIAAPLPEFFKSVAEAEPPRKALLVKAGELFDLVMHSFKVHGLYVHRELLGRLHILGEPDSAYLNNFTPQFDREFVKNGGF